MAKIVVYVVVLAILWCLFSALYIIGKHGFGRKETVRMLTWRIALSLGLFFFIVMAGWLGWIHPHLIAVAPTAGEVYNQVGF